MKLNNQVHYDDRMVENDVAKTPNLCGVFVRGMNGDRSTDEGDREKRKIGHFQKDEFLRHSHKVGTSQAMVHFQGDVFLAGGANHDTSAEGGDETRPRNVSLYFYVRVA
jgi:hypothetical protein